MKTIELKNKTWHSWLANKGTYLYKGLELDFCSYSRAVFLGTLLMLCLVIALGVIILTVGSMVYCMWYAIGYYFFHFPFVRDTVSIGSLGLLMFLGIAFIVICARRSTILNRRKQSGTYESFRHIPPPKPKPPSFLSLLYRKWKEKTCFKIKII